MRLPIRCDAVSPLLDVIDSLVESPAVLFHDVGDHCRRAATHSLLAVHQTFLPGFSATNTELLRIKGRYKKKALYRGNAEYSDPLYTDEQNDV